MGKKVKETCDSCGRRMERCRPVAKDEDGNIVEWACPTCWRELDYDRYVHKYYKGDDDGIR
jgi:hypothetical protein